MWRDSFLKPVSDSKMPNVHVAVWEDDAFKAIISHDKVLEQYRLRVLPLSSGLTIIDAKDMDDAKEKAIDVVEKQLQHYSKILEKMKTP